MMTYIILNEKHKRFIRKVLVNYRLLRMIEERVNLKEKIYVG